MNATKPAKSTMNRVRKPKPKTLAGQWNSEMLHRLTTVLGQSPEGNMVDLLGSRYSEQLQRLKLIGSKKNSTLGVVPPGHDVRSRLAAADSAAVIFEPSAELRALLPQEPDLAEGLQDLLANNEVLSTSDWAASTMVLKINENIVVKITNEGAALTEYHSLIFLHEHLPNFPAPRPHGLVRLGNFYLLFTAFVPGQNLEEIWPRLDNDQKRNITSQLDPHLTSLRSLSRPNATPLGNIQGDGCKDIRRDIRMSTGPIMTDIEFQDFIFSGSKTASSSYIKLLRDLIPKSPAKIVFTHGDIRPANIMVREGEDNNWRVLSIIDWEASGFYPEYWECIKATNNLTTKDNNDWYQYLTGPISQSTYRVYWLVDRLWDGSMVNS